MLVKHLQAAIHSPFLPRSQLSTHREISSLASIHWHRPMHIKVLYIYSMQYNSRPARFPPLQYRAFHPSPTPPTCITHESHLISPNYCIPSAENTLQQAAAKDALFDKCISHPCDRERNTPALLSGPIARSMSIESRCVSRMHRPHVR
jgi:hypothetical protein